MKELHRKRLLLLAQELDIAYVVYPSPITFGWKDEFGQVQEKTWMDYGQDMGIIINIFPEEWIYNENHALVLADNPEAGPLGGMLKFFDLEIWEYVHLFCAYLQNTEKYGGRVLTDEADGIKPKHIAYNIRQFLIRKK